MDADEDLPNIPHRLPDVTRLPLEDLLSSDDSVIANALRRVITELDQPQEIIAAFDSSVGGQNPRPAD